ncbi:hypothetical protein BaRGS_00038390 [Batillaria attramentaria]|uniref:ZU5 domain-containing protein n=1 Tax=Batillaria attramentaria TaxID=370345 RepID=A0ABD0J5U3_9CAEN
MDTRHQRLLNKFGLVGHAILKSSRDQQRGVHVVYGIHSTDFVLSNMKEELETRTGLRLVLPDLKHDVLSVKESPFLDTLALCRDTLVVLDNYDTLDEVYENTLQQAVKEAEHPDGRTVFIQRGRLCHDWVLNKLEMSTLMIYPHDAGHQLYNRKTDFWATVAAFLGLRYHIVRRGGTSDRPAIECIVVSQYYDNESHQLVEERLKNKSSGIWSELQEIPESTARAILQGQEESVLHHPRQTGDTRQHSATGIHKVAAGSGIVLPTTSAGDGAAVHKSMIVITDSVMHRWLDFGMYSGGDEKVTQTLVQQAENIGCKITAVILNYLTYSWEKIRRLQRLTNTLLILLDSEPRPAIDIIDAFNFVLESAGMDTRHQSLLNNFGPVRHAILRSSRDPQQGVHVVYGTRSTDFVLSNMKEELETRTGLRLVLPDLKHDVLSVKESPFLATLCRNTLVVLDDDYRLHWMHKNLLRQAVQEAAHPDGRTVFIQRGRLCPDWVLNRLEHTSTLLIYPHDAGHQLDRNRYFWATVAAFLDQRVHSILTVTGLFGPIRQAVLETPDGEEGAICVLYHHSTEQFVYGAFAEQVEKRSSLRIVRLFKDGSSPPATLQHFERASQLCRHTLVLLGRSLLAQGVDSAHFQSTIADASKRSESFVFVLFGDVIIGNMPEWLHSKLKSSFWCRYSKPGQESTESFWDVLIGVIESRLRVTRGSSEHAVQTGKTEDEQPIHIPELSHENASQSDDEGVSEGEFEHSSCTSSDASLSRSASVHVELCAPETDQDKHEAPDTEAVDSPTPGSLSAGTGSASAFADTKIQVEDGTNERQSAQDTHRVQTPTPLQPIFSTDWQIVDTLTSSGGIVRKEYSDAILTVPPDAIEEDSQVDIHTAVCTDVDRVRQVVKLSEDECVSSPVAEYWAGHEFRFKKPVTITLPHFLPPDPDPSLVRVYRVTRSPDGQFIVTRLNPGQLSDCTPETGQSQDWNEDEPLKGADTSKASSAQSVQESEHTEKSTEDVVWEKTGYFWLSSADHITVITDHFSAYVCTYCGKDQGPPVLKAVACGSHDKNSSGLWVVHISLHVWDRRLKMLDFQQEFGVPSDEAIGKRSISLRGFPGQLQESNLHVRLVLVEQERWQFCLRSNGRPHEAIDYFLSCDSDTCAVVMRERTCPVHYEWLVESKSLDNKEPLLRFFLDICHHSTEQTPSWDDEENLRIKTWPLRYPRHIDQRESTTQTGKRTPPSTPPAACDTTGRSASSSPERIDSQGSRISSNYQNSSDNTQMKETISVSPPQSQRQAPYPQNMPAMACQPTQAPFPSQCPVVRYPALDGETEWRSQHQFPIPQNSWHSTQPGASSPLEGAASLDPSISGALSAASGNPFRSNPPRVPGSAVGNLSDLSSGLSQAMPLSSSRVNGPENGIEVQHVTPSNTVPANTTGTPPGAAGGGTCNQYWHNHPVVIHNNNFHINKIQGSPNFASTVTTHHKHRGASGGNSDLHALDYADETPLQALQGLRDNDTDIPESFHEEYNAEHTDEVRSPSLNSQHGAYFSDTRNPVCNPSQ